MLIEYRWAESNFAQLPELAADLVRLKVDLILARSSIWVQAAIEATSSIPIVLLTHADPVGLGHVASLAKPGGNITGPRKSAEIPRPNASRSSRISSPGSSVSPSFGTQTPFHTPRDSRRWRRPGARSGSSYRLRSFYSSLLKVEGDVHGHEKASKRLASLQAMSPATQRRDAASRPDVTRSKV
jgi:hypothetical protein